MPLRAFLWECEDICDYDDSGDETKTTVVTMNLISFCCT